MKLSFHVIEKKILYVGLSIALIVVSLALITFKGFVWGIDFESGLSVSVEIKDSTIEGLRSAMSPISGARIQNLGSSDNGRYKIRVGLVEGENQVQATEKVTKLLSANYDSVVVLESNYIGAKFSSSLVSDSLKAVAIALVLILVYIWVRFKVAYSISAIIPLMHDVVATLGFLSLIGYEITSTTIAALLTIIGYSLNNTIVIFTRIRERLADNREEGILLAANWGVNSSLTRTTYSSLTTLFAVIPLAIFASGDVRCFAISMIFGVVVGTYSSNFLAPNLLYIFGSTKAMDILKVEAKEDLSDEAMAQRVLDEDKGPKILV